MENCHPSIPLYNSVLQMVGSEDEIGMKRTETDIYDHIYNQMSNVLMKRITAVSTKEGLRMTSSDVDCFYYLTNHHCVWDLAEAQRYDPDTETVILMEYQEHIPATVYLRLLNMHPSNNAVSKRPCIQMCYHTYISSKVFLEAARSIYYGDKVFKHGPCQTNTVAGNDFDTAVGFACKKWPSQTNHLIERCKKFGWPEKHILDNMMSSGCFSVPTGSKQSRHDNDTNLELEWRLSFDEAEQILVRAMTHCQFLCYASLKVFLQEVLNKNLQKEEKLLCSYLLKTSMFWCI